MKDIVQKIKSLSNNPIKSDIENSDLMEILDFLMDININKHFYIYEDLFDSIDLSLTPSIIILSLLRSPFVYRKKIKNYFNFLERAKLEMKKRNLLNTLHGLDSDLYL